MDGQVVAFGSDAAYLQDLAQVYMIGPGSIHYAHSQNEQIKVQELTDGIEIYVQLVCDLLER
jgi:acetylornithine deacetylase